MRLMIIIRMVLEEMANGQLTVKQGTF